jgi:kinesin family protein 6/9
LEQRSRDLSDEKIIHSKLNLVDLAGSERLKKTGTEGSVMREARCISTFSFILFWGFFPLLLISIGLTGCLADINKSLSFLEQVVVALGDKNREHIPYRQTMLTNVLKDSLGGNCKTFLIANIWGAYLLNCCFSLSAHPF